jgi:DNA (cytosine-5)-methyltransferase 1
VSPTYDQRPEAGTSHDPIAISAHHPSGLLRIGSLFSGYGGLDMAVIAAIGGGRVAWHSDIKPASVALLAHRHPDVPNLGDMTALFPSDEETPVDHGSFDPIDVLAASWPCQPHSAAGKRLGEADPRALWPNVVRAVAETRPAVFFGENVARIASNGELRRVVRGLADLGYVGAWRVFSAADSGACHLRKRCFVVAVDPAAYTEREAGWLAGHAEPGDRAGSSGVRPAQPGRRDHGALTLLPTPKASDGEKGGPGMRGRKGDLFLPSAVMQLLTTPTARDWKDNGDFTVNDRRRSLPHQIKSLGERPWGKYTAAIAQHERVLGRPAPAPTQISLRNGKPQLSARFVEWMMMLPEGHVTDVPNLVDSPRKSERNAMLSLLGDGVVPAQGAAAFRFLLAHLAERLAGEVAA